MDGHATILRELVLWQRMLSLRFGYASCVKVDGRWYWAWANYEDHNYFECLFTDDLTKLGFSVMVDDSPLPEDLRQYLGADDQQTHLNLIQFLPNLTLDTLAPLSEKSLRMWLSEGRCPHCGAKGRSHKRDTFDAVRDGIYLEIVCRADRCEHRRRYKVLPEGDTQ